MSADMRAALEQARRALAECSSAMEDEQNDAMIGDAMSVIDEALASQAAQGEAVAIDRKREMAAFSNWAWLKQGVPIGRMGGQAAGIAAWMGRAELSAPPAPAVPEAMPKRGEFNDYYVSGWNACRAAMLAAAPDAPR